jgi:hypothetical protein
MKTGPVGIGTAEN